MFIFLLIMIAFSVTTYANYNQTPSIKSSIYNHFISQTIPQPNPILPVIFGTLGTNIIFQKGSNITEPQSGGSKKESINNIKTPQKQNVFDAEALLSDLSMITIVTAVPSFNINDSLYYFSQIRKNDDLLLQTLYFCAAASCITPIICIPIQTVAHMINPLFLTPGITYASVNRLSQAYKAYYLQNNRRQAAIHVAAALILATSSLLTITAIYA